MATLNILKTICTVMEGQTIIVCVWQVLNVGDHWITVTNKFSADPNAVYKYDSLHGRVLATNTVVRLTSLLHQHVESDHICVVRPICARQRHLSRLCGYFTLAAAYAVCSGEAPTGRKDDSSVMVSFIDTNLLTDSVDVVPHLPDVRVGNPGTIVVDKRHCLQCYFSYGFSVSVTVVIFQLQLQLLFFSFYFYFS